MHTKFILTALVLGLSISLDARAEQLNSSFTLASSTLLGVQASVRQGGQSGKVSKESAKCVQAIQVSAVIPVFDSAIAANWSKSEIAEIEKFLNTSLGKKFVKMSLLKAGLAYGESPSEPIPLFSGEEVSHFQKFQKTSAGQQFLVRTEFAKEESRAAIQSKIVELLASCGVK